MRFRNKKTGQEGNFIINKDHFECVDLDYVPEYRNLAELNEEWEDYEEPKEYWCIDWTGGVNHITVLDGVDKYKEDKKAIGNYFETKEEAEKAAEKLKAYKRLKDKGFKFNCWYGGSRTIDFEIADYKELLLPEEICDDLNLLFGGED